jgi:hypothetical protein
VLAQLEASQEGLKSISNCVAVKKRKLKDFIHSMGRRGKKFNLELYTETF